MASFAINITYIECVNTETQITADAAVKAATRTYVMTGDKSLALTSARDAASRNLVGGIVIPINAPDLEFGTSTRNSSGSQYDFTAGKNDNAVRLTTTSLASSSTPLIEPIFPLFDSVIEIQPLKTATSTQLAIDISLVVDRSGSMTFAANEIAGSTPYPASAPSGWIYGDPVPPTARWLDLIAAINGFNS